MTTETTQIVTCPNCGAKNRVPADRLAHGDQPVCGRCKTPLSSEGVAESGRPIVVTDATFRELVEQSDVPVLVDLWAPWCGPCRMLTPTLERIAAHYGNRVRVAKVNVDENPSLANRFQARSIPLLVIVNQGQEVDRLVGLQPEGVIRQKLDRFVV